ncbi:MAG: carbohydrate ABC transporter permease [Ruminococcaceae bacterium]|nr:carbohydrate ABC transporter permease [Oscillospiraceae bacterium]
MAMQRQTMSDKTFDIINLVLLLAITLVVLYPLYFTVIASFSDPYAVVRGEVLLFIKDFTIEPYKNVFVNDEIWIGYFNSIVNTAVSVIYNLALTIPAAFVLSRKTLKGRNIFMGFFVFTMYFGGGMIPGYLLVKNLGLMNTRWALIIPAGFSVYNMIIARTFFQSTFSEELFEAAKIDGCSVFGIFFKIVLPLSGAIVAVIALYVAVGHWNSWFGALLYITKKELYPLQYILRSILIQNQEMNVISTEGMQNAEMIQYFMRRRYMAEGMKYSLIFISSLPMLIAYPFVQKYFVKGVMIGAIKG